MMTSIIRAAIMSRLFPCNISIRLPLGLVSVWVVVWVGAGLMTRTTLATLVSPPPDPVIVSVNDPVGELAGIVSVRVEEKSGTDDWTLKVPPTPAGRPDSDKETWELKSFKPTTLTEYEALWPWVEVPDAGLTSILKSGACPIVNVAVVVCVFAPAVPVIVITYCPGATDDVVETESIELKLGDPDVGLSDVETPLGAPETDKTTFCVEPETRLTVIV
jgi:hypothetical protein